jgi:NAD(P)-dependent dehydrogenase (short-subunit alcohol dehydrogenase family)
MRLTGIGMILDDFRLDGKTALVTGAGRGLGRAMAEALAEAGANVVLAARSADALESAATAFRHLGIRALAVPTDVTVDADLERLVGRTLEELGRIDVLVNNHGTTFRAPAHEYPLAEWDRVMNVNLRSVFQLTTRVAREMIAAGRGGKIISIASVLSEIGVPLVPPYTASKGAIRALTKAWAVEWAQYGINVNAIGPGYFRTEMTEPLYQNPERQAIVMNRVAIKRWGRPEDLKGAVVFLAAPASDYVTGQVLYVDGGWLAK